MLTGWLVGWFYGISSIHSFHRYNTKGVYAKNLEITLQFVEFSKVFNCIHRGNMKQIQLAYCLPKETVTTIIMLSKNTKVMACSPDGNTEFFNIVTGGL